MSAPAQAAESGQRARRLPAAERSVGDVEGEAECAVQVGADHLGERGYRFFTSKKKLVWHLEEVLGFDIDGDRIVGEVDPGADTP